MTKKISAFWNNFKVYIVIAIAVGIILLGLALVVRNITKDKDDIVDVENTNLSEGGISQPLELTEEEAPVEPGPPVLELPKIQN